MKCNKPLIYGRRILLLCLICGSGLLLPTAVEAFDNYGAIAYSESSGKWGTAYNYSTRDSAEREAMSQCWMDDCQIVVWFRNACGALAVGASGAFGWGWAYTRAGAENQALSACSSRGTGCTIRCWACTDR